MTGRISAEEKTPTMIDQSELPELVAERHAGPQAPVPNADQAWVLDAASTGQLQINDAGRVVLRRSGYQCAVPKRAYESCLANEWIAPHGYLVPITPAGQAALDRRRQNLRTAGGRR